MLALVLSLWFSPRNSGLGDIHKLFQASLWFKLCLYHTWYFKDPLILNDKRLLAQKYSRAASLEVLRPFLFLDPVLWSDQPFLYCIKMSVSDFNKHLQTWLCCVNIIYNIPVFLDIQKDNVSIKLSFMLQLLNFILQYFQLSDKIACTVFYRVWCACKYSAHLNFTMIFGNFLFIFQ